jgi:hypothetical protein
MATPVTVGIADYSVVNDRSGIDDQCHEIVHWYATRVR